MGLTFSQFLACLTESKWFGRLFELANKKTSFSRIMKLVIDVKTIYIHGKFFRLGISPFKKAVVIERILWGINGSGITVFCQGNWFRSFLKDCYHNIGTFCNHLG